jgi:phospholipid/cholesterol/gamma-HCH transport system substrate-binding protein
VKAGRFDMKTLAKVTAFTVASLLLTVALGMRIANVGFFDETYTLEAEFSNASGVFEGDAVKLAGVDVGRVTGTRIEDGKAVVEFEVEEATPLTTETRVGIRWRNVIGLRFLYLYPAEGGQPLEEGDRIPLARTDAAGDVGEFLNRLGPVLQAIDPQKANEFLDAMNTALAGNEVVVQSLFTEGATLATELGAMDQQIQALIGNSDRILSAYASQDDDLGSIIDDLDTLGGELAGMTDQINSLVENFAIVQQEMERLLVENRGNIDATLAHLASVTGTLAENRKALRRTLCSLPPGVTPYYQTTSWGEWFNVRIVEFVVKDDQGKIIASASEPATARDPQAPPIVECPGGEAVTVPAGSGGAAPDQAGSPPAGTLDSWLDSIAPGGAA